MFRLIKQIYMAILSFRGSLATTCVSFNNEHCKTRLTLIDLNPPIEPKYYLFMISIDKCNGNCNSFDD